MAVHGAVAAEEEETVVAGLGRVDGGKLPGGGAEISQGRRLNARPEDGGGAHGVGRRLPQIDADDESAREKTQDASTRRSPAAPGSLSMTLVEGYDDNKAVILSEPDRAVAREREPKDLVFFQGVSQVFENARCFDLPRAGAAAAPSLTSIDNLAVGLGFLAACP